MAAAKLNNSVVKSTELIFSHLSHFFLKQHFILVSKLPIPIPIPIPSSSFHHFKTSSSVLHALSHHGKQEPRGQGAAAGQPQS